MANPKNYTWDSKKVNIVLGGMPITDFIDAVTITNGGEKWSIQQGLNDNVIHSKRSDNICTVSLPMNPMSAQYSAIKAMSFGNENSSEGIDFSYNDLNTGDQIIGKARIMSLGDKTNAEEAVARVVTLSVIKQMEA